MPIHTPLQVAVVSRPLADPDSGIKRRQIDLRATEDRGWLAKHQYWCMMNGYSLTLAPVEVEANDPA